MNSMLKKALRKIIFFSIYLLNRPFFYRLNKLLYDLSLQGMGITIAYPGRHGADYGEEKFLERHKQFLSGKTIIDIGANLGNYSQAVCKIVPNVTLFSFEPHPKLFPKLEEKAHRFGFTPIDKAVSDKLGNVKLYDFCEENETTTQASLVKETVEMFKKGIKSFNIECVTLDSFVTDSNIDHIGLLKIDTEGLDIRVLKGAEKTIKNKRVDIIQFELIPADVITKTFLKDFFDILTPQYDIYRQCLNGSLINLSPYDSKYCEIFCMTIFIAVRKDVSLA